MTLPLDVLARRLAHSLLAATISKSGGVITVEFDAPDHVPASNTLDALFELQERAIRETEGDPA